jgi:DNA-binding HxlR family transcriptional regulator
MQEEGLIKRAEDEDEVNYRVTPRGEDAFYVLLAFLRYGLKYHDKTAGSDRKNGSQ